MYLWSDLGGQRLIKCYNCTKLRCSGSRLRPVIHRLMGVRLVRYLAYAVSIRLAYYKTLTTTPRIIVKF